MELFHQTVSMKAVDNLNDFVRQHMLEPFDVRTTDRRAGQPLRRPRPRPTKRWSERGPSSSCSAPLVAELDTHDELAAEMAELGAQRDALPFFLAERRRGLLQPAARRPRPANRRS